MALPSLSVNTFRQHGVEFRVPQLPEGWQVVDTYHPHSSPWDYYGNNHQREILCVLAAAGVDALAFEEKAKSLCPRGTGPGGRVRFGDDMMPSTYRVAVQVDQVSTALAAIAEHQVAVRAWVFDNGPRPAACA